MNISKKEAKELLEKLVSQNENINDAIAKQKMIMNMDIMNADMISLEIFMQTLIEEIEGELE